MTSTTLHINDKAIELEAVEKKAGEVRFTLNGKQYHYRSHKLADGSFALEEETAPGQWKRLTGGAWQGGKNIRRIQVGTLDARVSEILAGATTSSAGALSPVAPMPGMVRQMLVKKGDKVKQGQALVVVEAMKLQLTLSAGADATVDAILVKEGQMVPEGAELVKLTALKPKK